MSTVAHSAKDVKSVGCDVMCLCCVDSASPLLAWRGGCFVGLVSVLTAWLYQCNQMKGKCPLDCMPVVHPNNKARNEFIDHSLLACILLAVVVFLVIDTCYLRIGLIAMRRDNLITS